MGQHSFTPRLHNCKSTPRHDTKDFEQEVINDRLVFNFSQCCQFCCRGLLQDIESSLQYNDLGYIICSEGGNLTTETNIIGPCKPLTVKSAIFSVASHLPILLQTTQSLTEKSTSFVFHIFGYIINLRSRKK